MRNGVRMPASSQLHIMGVKRGTSYTEASFHLYLTILGGKSPRV